MKKYWLNWTVACGAGEFLGIGVAAGIGFSLFFLLGEPQNIGQRLLIIAGMVIIFLGASLPTPETRLAVVILIGTVSGLLAGLSVGAITGLFLIRLKSTGVAEITSP